MKSALLFVIFSVFVVGITPVFAEEQLDLLISPLIVKTTDPHVEPKQQKEMLIVRDVKNSLTWHTAYPEIDGLDYVEGNAYLISAKKSFALPLDELPKYKLVEVKQVFKSHKPYSWKSQCVPGYHTWTDGNCVFAFRCSEYAYPGKPCTTGFDKQDYLRPLHQHKVGIFTEDTICLETLKLLISGDDIPVCVKPSSVDKLLERGFTIGKNNNNSPYDE